MKSYIKEFQEKINNRQAKIAVVGLGYVGLPLALEFAKKGFVVKGIDIDKDRLSHLKKKVSYITDITTQELRRVLNLGKFTAAGDFRAVKDAEVILICVPTPLKRKYEPNISYIKKAMKAISKNIKKGSLIILESTTYPGTTEEEILPIFEESGLKHNRDFYLSFSPERIDPGNPVFTVDRIPKVVGGITKEATMLAACVYSKIVKKVVPVSSARTAEAEKLLENTFRLVNIGLIDELAMMAHKMGIDIWEVIDAASTKPFGFMPFYPGPGVGGHCIPKDPLYLYWKARRFGFKSRFIKLASDVISNMPGYVARRAEEALKKNKILFSRSKILVVGVTYKKDIKDLRQSPALDILSVLKAKKVKVSYFDPLIPYLKLVDFNLRSIEFTKEALRRFDCVIIATDHTGINYKFLLENSRLILDTRNVYKGINERKVIRL